MSVGVLKVASFQVILAYNVHRSFTLIYYGDVAEAGLPWQVSEVAYCFLCTVQMTKKLIQLYHLKRIAHECRKKLFRPTPLCLSFFFLMS